jgi:FkbM family methyltransferase
MAGGYQLGDSMSRPYFPQEFDYTINGLVLKLPMGHRLPFYQAKFAKYDKFLSYIVKRLEAGSSVLDIGANCGDTLAAIVPAGPRLRYYAVEPSDNYYKYLEQNIETIRKAFPLVSLAYTKSLVGNSDGLYTLIEKGGTATAVKVQKQDDVAEKNSKSLAKTSLTQLVKAQDSQFRLRLLKTDTDGMDWDVINSGLEVIKDAHPILFFECDPQNTEAFLAYQSTFEKLNNLGYNHFYIFDNYGEYVCSLNKVSPLVDFMRYCYAQDQRTIHYIDVLACVAKDAALVESAINEFNSNQS